MTTSVSVGVLQHRERVILLVEDELPLRQLVSGLLHSSGYTVLSTGSAAEAIRVFKERNGRISLLLTDVNLAEGISGIRLAERLKTISPNLPIVITSGSPEQPMEFQDKTHFMAKPFAPSDLLRKIEEALSAGEPTAAADRVAKRRVAQDRHHLS